MRFLLTQIVSLFYNATMICGQYRLQGEFAILVFTAVFSVTGTELPLDYTNPVWGCDAPDPTVWEGDCKYYAASTHQDILQSDDLVHWKPLGWKLLEGSEYAWIRKSWTDIWAPDVVKTAEGYVLYVCYHGGGRPAAIAAYRSKTASGPFADRKIVLSGEVAKGTDVIDPEVVKDAEGRVWLFFGHGAVQRVELTADGLGVKPGVPIEHVAGIPWEVRGERKYFSHECSTEAPYLHQHGGKWYLFVSLGSWVNHTYHVAVGRADSPGGRFFDKEGRPMAIGFSSPILTSAEGDEFFGPGHNGEIFTMPSGRTYMFYHCHWSGSKDAKPGSGYVPRPLFLQEILWDKDGWPYFANGGKPQKKCSLL